MGTTYTVKCRRCSGTGIWFEAGLCFGCNGAGVKTATRYTAEEKAAKRALAERSYGALKRITTRTRELAGGRRNSRLEWDARYGFTTLRDREPERFAKMLDSLDAGRLDDVIHALAKYYRD